MSKEAILNAYQAIIPAMKSVEQSIICFNMPFTFLKAMLSVLVTFLIYKRIPRLSKASISKNRPAREVSCAGFFTSFGWKWGKPAAYGIPFLYQTQDATSLFPEKDV